MKLIFCIIILIVATMSLAQTTDNHLTVGKIDSIQSQVLNETRKIWVRLPEGYHEKRQRYPLTIVLDPEDHFYPTTGTIFHLSRNSTCPSMIVVGLVNQDRIRDFTPTVSALRNSGGAEKFTSFLRDELLPYLEKHYSTNSEKLIVGHSLGGLFVINTMLTQADLFNHYIAIDPSLSYDNQKSLIEFNKILEAKSLKGKSLFLALASTNGIDTTNVQKSTEDATLHLRSILSFKSQLEKSTKTGFDWNFKYYKDESHESIPFIGIYDGLNYIFRTKYISLSSNQLKVFEGKYHMFDVRQGTYEYLKITAKSDHLVFKPDNLWDSMEMRFSPVSDLHFYCKEMRIPVEFIKDKKGMVINVLMFNSVLWEKVSD